MSLQVGAAVADAARRLASLAGLGVVAAFAGYNLLYAVALDSLVVATAPSVLIRTTFAVGIGAGVASALLVVSLLLGAAAGVLGARVFAGERGSDLTRRPVTATLSTLVVNLVTSIAVVLGMVALVVPGLYLATSLLFGAVFVAVEDEGPVAALRSSWSLATGHRWRLLALLVVVVAIQAGIGAVSVGLAVASPFAGAVTARLLGAVTVAFVLAVVVAAYDQLREEAAAEPEPEPEESEPVGALSAEDLDDVDW